MSSIQLGQRLVEVDDLVGRGAQHRIPEHPDRAAPPPSPVPQSPTNATDAPRWVADAVASAAGAGEGSMGPLASGVGVIRRAVVKAEAISASDEPRLFPQ
jgi:hypothetical protein